MYRKKYLTLKKNYLEQKGGSMVSKSTKSTDSLIPKPDFPIESNVPIFISGFAASGKSTYAKKLAEEHNRVLIEMDEIIRSIKSMFPEEIQKKINFFRVYRVREGDFVMKAKDIFVTVLKSLIDLYKGDVVLEGMLESHSMIERIFGTDPYTLVLIRVEDEDEYAKRIAQRFKADPTNYGRIAELRNSDEDGKMLELFLKEKDINNLKIQKFIKDATKLCFSKHEKYYDSYKSLSPITIWN